MLSLRTLQLVLLATGSIACGIAGQWVLLTEIGPGADTDAYFAALVLPQVLLAIASGPLLNVLVPMLTMEDATRRNYVVWALVKVIGGPCAVGALLLGLLAPYWVPLTAPGFGGEQMDLAVMLARIQTLIFALSVFALVLSAGAQAAGRPLRVESAAFAASSIGLAVTVVLVSQWGVTAAACAGVVRVLAQGMLILPLFATCERGCHDGSFVGSVWVRMRPLLISGSLAKTDPLIDRALLSMSTDGSLSLFQLGQGVFAAVIEVFYRSSIAPAMPGLARDAAADPVAFRRHTNRLLVLSAIALFAGVLAFYVFGETFLRLALDYGRFSSESVAQLWWIMFGLTGVLVGACIGQIGAIAFYAHGDTLTPARLSIRSFAIFAPLKVVAFFAFGLVGVVGACSAYYLTNAAILLFLMHRQRRRRA